MDVQPSGGGGQSNSVSFSFGHWCSSTKGGRADRRTTSCGEACTRRRVTHGATQHTTLLPHVRLPRRSYASFAAWGRGKTDLPRSRETGTATGNLTGTEDRHAASVHTGLQFHAHVRRGTRHPTRQGESELRKGITRNTPLLQCRYTARTHFTPNEVQTESFTTVQDIDNYLEGRVTPQVRAQHGTGLAQTDAWIRM